MFESLEFCGREEGRSHTMSSQIDLARKQQIVVVHWRRVQQPVHKGGHHLKQGTADEY